MVTMPFLFIAAESGIGAVLASRTHTHTRTLKMRAERESCDQARRRMLQAAAVDVDNPAAGEDVAPLLCV